MKITRRGLLISGGLAGGGMLLGVAGIGAWISSYNQAELQREELEVQGARMMAQYISLTPAGEITLYTPHTEMGQGTQTGLLQILLDELDADPAHTRVELAPASSAFTHRDIVAGILHEQADVPAWATTFVEKTSGRLAQLIGLQFTGGSLAVRFTGWRGIRRAAACSRHMLVQAAAATLSVPASELTTLNSTVFHAKSGKSIGYGDLADLASGLQPPDEPVFKPRSEWRYINKDFPRIDLPDKVFATAEYGIDVAVPNMRYAAVAPPPMGLATITSITNSSEVKAMRGVEAIVNLGDVVAVVADNPWRAEQAARAVQMETTPAAVGALDDAEMLALRQKAVRSGDLGHLASKGEGALDLSGEGVIEAEYVVPYLAHVPMEPLNATVWTEGDLTHVATGVQGPLAARTRAAKVLGKSVDQVVLHAKTMGGGFGRRNALLTQSLNWVDHACKIHNAVGGAVKMTWSREADLKLSTLRPLDVARVSGRLGPDGKPSHYSLRSYAPIAQAAEVIPPYNIPNVSIECASAEHQWPYGFWRSVDASSHVFFIESFIDELARAAKQDPLAYRLSLLDENSRAAGVLKKVAEMSRWSEGAPEGHAYGVALVHGFGSYCAEVMEVSLVKGKPRVHNVWAAIDCGTAVSPNSVEAQVEGGIHFGLSAALYGQVQFTKGVIQQTNFHNYPVVTFRDAPRIQVAIVDSFDAEVGGVGEVSTPPVAPALTNALAALADRTRSLPVVS